MSYLVVTDEPHGAAVQPRQTCRHDTSHECISACGMRCLCLCVRVLCCCCGSLPER